jgi:hypothetical protein
MVRWSRRCQRHPDRCWNADRETEIRKMTAYLIVGLVIAALGAVVGIPLANRERRARLAGTPVPPTPAARQPSLPLTPPSPRSSP